MNESVQMIELLKVLRNSLDKMIQNHERIKIYEVLHNAFKNLAEDQEVLKLKENEQGE